LNQSTLKAIKSQMNPHFFYNALNTIQSYILANDKKQAVNYLSKFSSLTRTILEMSEKETVTVAEEIKTLSFYLDIEKARFNDDFEYEIIINEATLEQIKIPSLLIQPYVENAIKHGLLHKNGAKKLTIVFEENGNYLDISIIDNGIGRTKSEELKLLRKNPHQSFATEAMQQKIDLLNKHKINKISIEIIDNYSTQKTPKGTTVLIKIPLDFYYS
ncbi:MAG TPA: histidine kinase, partial [Flavobacterium sp.]|nr:histidine kinase [Flavobacterium sp.]